MLQTQAFEGRGLYTIQYTVLELSGLGAGSGTEIPRINFEKKFEA